MQVNYDIYHPPEIRSEHRFFIPLLPQNEPLEVPVTDDVPSIEPIFYNDVFLYPRGNGPYRHVYGNAPLRASLSDKKEVF